MLFTFFFCPSTLRSGHLRHCCYRKINYIYIFLAEIYCATTVVVCYKLYLILYNNYLSLYLYHYVFKYTIYSSFLTQHFKPLRRGQWFYSVSCFANILVFKQNTFMVYTLTSVWIYTHHRFDGSNINNNK